MRRSLLLLGRQLVLIQQLYVVCVANPQARDSKSHKSHKSQSNSKSRESPVTEPNVRTLPDSDADSDHATGPP